MRALTSVLAAVLLSVFVGSANAASPTVATDLYVDSTNAQAGTQGDPVTDIDQSPVPLPEIFVSLIE